MSDPCCDEREYYQARYDATVALIVAWEEAYMSLSSGAIQNYQVDTGQTRQLVTKVNIATLKNAISDLEDRRDYYKDKLCGTGSFYGRPGF